jgi:hypothetical protein
MQGNDGFRTETKHPSPAGVRIRVSAAHRLKASGYGALRGVSCVVESGVLHLHGSVPSYYLKQLAEALVTGIDGVCPVVKGTEVARPSSGEATRFLRAVLGKRPYPSNLDEL